MSRALSWIFILQGLHLLLFNQSVVGVKLVSTIPATKLPYDPNATPDVNQYSYKPQEEADYSNSTKDNYFLEEEELQDQVESLHAFITNQMQLPSSNNTVAHTKINATALGFPDLSAFRQIFSGFGDTIKRDAVCSGCQVFLGVLSHQIKVRKSSEPSLTAFSTFTCNFFRLAAPEVCVGVLERLAPSFYFIVSTRPKVKSSIMCGLMFQSLGCRIPSRAIIGTDFEYNVDTLRSPGQTSVGYPVPRPALNIFPSKDYRTPLGLAKNPNKKVMKVVHLADLHIDYDYKPGTKAECDNEILCCQERNGYPDPNKNITGAGLFGDNRKCDAPITILHMALNQIRNTHGSDIDMIYMTGDLVPHNIWYSTQEDNTNTIRGVSKVLHEYFPEATIIPCLGNHEPHPVNSFSPTSRTFGSPEKNPIPPSLRTDWVYDVAYESWSQWIPPDQKETFLSSGHFAVEINPKFRVLVVNTNVCYGFNMWQLYDPQDPGQQLEWLNAQLVLTQAQNQTAHIVGHVPPGHEDCFKTWSREFYKIVAKHRNVIRGQFYGHTHYDEFRVLHDPLIKTDPVNIMWVGPSLTPYRIHNPGYRIYHVDISDQSGSQVRYGDVVDHETWIYDLDKANREAALELDMSQNLSSSGLLSRSRRGRLTQPADVPWFQLYKATDIYGIKNLLPINLKRFVIRMAKDRKTFDAFYRYYFKAIDPDHQKKDPCDTICRKRILCGVVQSYYDDDDGQVECKAIQKEVDGVILPMRVLEHRKRFIWL